MLEDLHDSAMRAVADLDEDRQVSIMRYIKRLEIELDIVFNSLAQSNVYNPELNRVWMMLGQELGKVHSSDPPYFDKRKRVG